MLALGLRKDGQVGRHFNYTIKASHVHDVHGVNGGLTECFTFALFKQFLLECRLIKLFVEIIHFVTLVLRVCKARGERVMMTIGQAGGE